MNTMGRCTLSVFIGFFSACSHIDAPSSDAKDLSLDGVSLVMKMPDSATTNSATERYCGYSCQPGSIRSWQKVDLHQCTMQRCLTRNEISVAVKSQFPTWSSDHDRYLVGFFFLASDSWVNTTDLASNLPAWDVWKAASEVLGVNNPNPPKILAQFKFGNQVNHKYVEIYSNMKMLSRICFQGGGFECDDNSIGDIMPNGVNPGRTTTISTISTTEWAEFQINRNDSLALSLVDVGKVGIAGLGTSVGYLKLSNDSDGQLRHIMLLRRSGSGNPPSLILDVAGGCSNNTVPAPVQALLNLVEPGHIVSCP